VPLTTHGALTTRHTRAETLKPPYVYTCKLSQGREARTRMRRGESKNLGILCVSRLRRGRSRKHLIKGAHNTTGCVCVSLSDVRGLSLKEGRGASEQKEGEVMKPSNDVNTKAHLAPLLDICRWEGNTRTWPLRVFFASFKKPRQREQERGWEERESISRNTDSVCHSVPIRSLGSDTRKVCV